MSDRLLASISSILFGVFFMLPWVMVRSGKHKRWYLAPFAPPLMWGRAVYMWPMGTFFLVLPFLPLFGFQKDALNNASGIIAITALVFAIIMIGWTPDWAKPKWQRYLEDKYTWSEIRGTFIPAWRKMDRKEWATLLDSEAGIRELVRRARQSKQA